MSNIYPGHRIGAVLSFQTFRVPVSSLAADNDVSSGAMNITGGLPYLSQQATEFYVRENT